MRVKANFKDLFVLFWTFFKIGLFTFGGGYAMIPLIERDIVEKKGWLDQSVASDMVAIAEATPGPIAVNMATFVGCQRCGVLGAFFATLGLVLPSFVIIIVISLCLALVQDNVWVASAFKGIRVGVVVLIANAGIKMTKKMPKLLVTIVMCIVAFGLAAFTGIDVVFIIIGGGIVGIVYQTIVANKQLKNKEENA